MALLIAQQCCESTLSVPKYHNYVEEICNLGDDPTGSSFINIVQ